MIAEPTINGVFHNKGMSLIKTHTEVGHMSGVVIIQAFCMWRDFVILAARAMLDFTIVDLVP